MYTIKENEYSTFKNIYHYNLLAALSLHDFKCRTGHVVRFFSKSIPLVLNNYMYIDTSLFYEYVKCDVSEYTDALNSNSKSLYELLRIFDSENKNVKSAIKFDEFQAFEILELNPEIKWVIKKDENCSFSTEAIHFIDLTRVIHFLIYKFPSSVLNFPFDHLPKIFYSYNTLKLIACLTHSGIHPKLMNFTKLLHNIFKPFLIKSEKEEIEEQVQKLKESEEKQLIEVKRVSKFYREDKNGIFRFESSSTEDSFSNLISNLSLSESEKSSDSVNYEELDNKKIEIIFTFLHRLIVYKYKHTNSNVLALLFPYKSTILNLFNNLRSKYLTREIFNNIALLQKNGISLLPKLHFECMNCKYTSKFNDEDLFFKDVFGVQIYRNALLYNLIEEIEFTTCGCSILNFKTENIYQNIEIAPENKRKYSLYNFEDMCGENIYFNHNITSSFIQLTKYYFYVSLHSKSNIIHTNLTFIVINILRSGRLGYIYDLICFILKFLYEKLFQCWIGSLENIIYEFEPFLIRIYKNIHFLKDKWLSKTNYVAYNTKHVELYALFNKLFANWFNEEWCTLRLGYLTRQINKHSLQYRDKNKVEEWLEDVFSEPYMRYISYCICEDIPESEFLE